VDLCSELVSEVLTAVTLKIIRVRDVTLCRVEFHGRFRGMDCPYHLGQPQAQKKKQEEEKRSRRRWRQYVPSKQPGTSNGPDGVTSQKFTTVFSG
jgi:hypothetical protein